MKIDMHYHTDHSDGAATVSETLEKMRELKIGVAITDHNEISGSLEAIEKKRKDDIIIPGIEARSSEGVDVLFYFYETDELKKFFEKEILPFRKMKFYKRSTTTRKLETFLELKDKYACIAVIPHPFGYSMRTGKNDVFEKNEKSLEKFEIFEWVNGGTDKKNNLRAQEYIKKNKKKFTAGSDGHSIHRLGKVLTTSSAKNTKEFLDNIKEGKVSVTGDGFSKFKEYYLWMRNKIGI